MALTQLNSMNCPNCGGVLEHKGNGYYVCPFCDSQFHDSAHQAGAAQQPAEEKKQKKPATEDNVADVVLDTLFEEITEEEVDDRDALSLSEDPDDHPKIDKAARSFDIPDEVEIWLIWDETFFGGCKYGFAITSDGIYSNYKENGGLVHIGWKKFVKSKLKAELYTLYIGETEFGITGGDNAFDLLANAIKKVQENLKEEIDW